MNRNGEVIGKQENPGKFKLGADKKYFYDFYNLLSTYAHCNFSVASNYLDKDFTYTITKVNDSLLVRMIVVFVFSKLFELIVTVDGEDFKDSRTEKNCYQLVEDAIKLLESVLDELKNHYTATKNDTNKYINKRMKELMKDMEKSLKEELGSISKVESSIP